MQVSSSKTAADAAAWDAYVARNPVSTLYHLRAWATVARVAYRYETPFLMARDDAGGVRGVLPLFRVPRPGSPYLTTGPFGAYGPLLADDEATTRALVAAAKGLVDEGVGSFLHLKVLGAAAPGIDLERRDVWVTAHLDLDRSPEALWARFPRSMRGKIRRAEKEPFVVGTDAADLDAFYDVLGENMFRKGSPMYGRPFFRSLLAELAPKATVITLRLHGKVVSAAFLAWHHEVMYVPFASSRPSVFALGANNLLYWEIQRFAHQQGLRTLDFGTSLRATTALAFKESFHPTIVPVGSYLYAKRGVSPALEPKDSRLARGAVLAWTRLPRRVAETVGPWVIRWIA